MSQQATRVTSVKASWKFRLVPVTAAILTAAFWAVAAWILISSATARGAGLPAATKDIPWFGEAFGSLMVRPAHHEGGVDNACATRSASS